ncbi:hypothetical protein PR048_023898 [Dryococelus australis]|uniref:Uncharacterized protein n=1 Tax=Dryococelus australis TaxID=614101 RepID=A0ABQ9GVC1_9NEOP|nr:hypothetical protein PR048_023898 [Dryococelus australis]
MKGGKTGEPREKRSHGDLVARALASHQDDPGLIPGRVGPQIFACGNRAGAMPHVREFSQGSSVSPTIIYIYICLSHNRYRQAQGLAGSLRIFANGNCAGQCRRFVSFLGDLLLPSPLHSGAAPYSPHFTLIGSQDLDIKSCLNLLTPLTRQDVNRAVKYSI